MGSGKTTIGRNLAKQLHKQFVDSDQEIEKRTGAAISLIFEIEGESGFRERESKIVEALTLRKNIVLATGGGAILEEDNRRAMRRSGTVVYLHTPVETQLKRTTNSKPARPPPAILMRLYPFTAGDAIEAGLMPLRI